MKEYDVIVIGSGAGMTVGSAAFEQGLSVAIVENGPMGGTFDLSFVNATESALTLSCDWEIHNPNATIGAANNEGPFLTLKNFN